MSNRFLKKIAEKYNLTLDGNVATGKLINCDISITIDMHVGFIGLVAFSADTSVKNKTKLAQGPGFCYCY